MAFLDNSGDIILDAVLTDAGRKRMAQGRFKITKFAFGDEEINYKLWQPDHPSGSSFYGQVIQQTPILEAFTNNTSTMKTHLLTIGRNRILYLPVIKVNDRERLSRHVMRSKDFKSGFILVANETAREAFNCADCIIPNGVLYGVGNIGTDNPNHIVLDQGIESNGDPSISTPIDDDLKETRYLIQMDHRILRLHGPNGVRQTVSFVDDDSIASYFVPFDGNMVKDIGTVAPDDEDKTNRQVYDGPLGTRLSFNLSADLNIRTSTALFNKLGPGPGTTITVGTGVSAVSGLQYMDTLVKVTGIGTGYSVDIPIRVIRK
jgi:hypothetical protein